MSDLAGKERIKSEESTASYDLAVACHIRASEAIDTLSRTVLSLLTIVRAEMSLWTIPVHLREFLGFTRRPRERMLDSEVILMTSLLSGQVHTVISTP